jgi:hypothetical protein
MSNKDSKWLTEVWKWKEIAYGEVENLPLDEAIEKRLLESLKTTADAGFLSKKMKKAI